MLYHDPGRRFLHDVLTAVRLGRPVSEIVDVLEPNGERHLKAGDDLSRTFHGRADLLARTRRIAGRCRFSLDELRYEYPAEVVPPGRTPMGHLTELVRREAAERYGGRTPAKVAGLIRHELRLIEECGYPHYFLTVHDLVRFARSRGILCQGRGAAANSAVCFCLGITSVDPMGQELLFERFISRERDEPPDIDVDFEHERREEVIQYVYRKYGRDRAGMTAAVITYRPRSALRDVGKALGLSVDRVDSLAKNIRRYGEEGTGEALKTRFREVGFDPDGRVGRQLIVLVRQLLGFPRHLSQHTGGMVISQSRLDELVPVENAAMADRTIVQWDKDDLDALGVLKVDILALGMLTAVRKCFGLLDRHGLAPELPRTGRAGRVGLADVPHHDEPTFRMIRRAETVGVFQIESRAQRASLPRTRPREYYDLVAQVALVRPGPIQGGMVHPYIENRRRGVRSSGMGPEIDAVLGRTYGVPIFQEQCLRLSVVAAGFSPGEAEQLRRSLSGWRRTGRRISDYEAALKDGIAAKGYPPGFADRLFSQIKGFGEYGFPESHAASFARLTWVSCYLKHHHPAAFFAALLNSQPLGFYRPAQLVREARRQGVEVRPVCVNASDWDCTLEAVPGPHRGRPALRLGFRIVSGAAEADAARIVRTRADGGRFRSVAEFRRRTALPRAATLRLAGADAFAGLPADRREAVWQALPAAADGLLRPADRAAHEPTPPLTSLTPPERVAADYAAAGLSLVGHPLTHLRPALAAAGVRSCRDLAAAADGDRTVVVGLVLFRQKPGSAKGVVFVTLEDETGEANLVIRPDVWERCHRPARTAPFLLATGRIRRDDSRKVLHLVAESVENPADRFPGLACADTPRSRDFH